MKQWEKIGNGVLIALGMALIYWAIRADWIRYQAIVDSILPAFLWMWWASDLSDKREPRKIARKIKDMSNAEKEQYFIDYPRHKLLVDRINPKYGFGMFLSAVTIVCYMWGVEAANPRDSWFRLIVCGVLAVLVFVWLSAVWYPSAQTEAERNVKLWERERKSWAKIRKRFRKVRTVEDFIALVAVDMRHRLCDDDPLGALDRSRPLVMYLGKPLTHRELLKVVDSVADQQIKDKMIEAKRVVENYLVMIGQKVVDNNTVAIATKE